MSGKDGISFPVSRPMVETGNEAGNETGNGVAKAVISNRKSGNEAETVFGLFAETKAQEPDGLFPCGWLNVLVDGQTRSSGNVDGRRWLL